MAAITLEKRPLSQDLRELARSPRELWLVYIAKFFESVGIFSMLYTLVLWLSKDYGFSDQGAGSLAGYFSSIVTLLTLGVGFVGDSLGIRRMLLVSFGASLLARSAMAFAPSKSFAVVGLLSLTIGYASGIPVLTAAVRRYSAPNARAFAFSIYYVIMNVGAFVAAEVQQRCMNAFLDPTTNKLVSKTIQLPLLGATQTSAYKMVFTIGLGFSLCAFLCALFLRPDNAVPDAEAELQGIKADAPRLNPLQIAREVVSEPAFWRFMAFIGLLAMVKLIFQHYHFTFPKYVQRELGENFPLGRVNQINPIMIVILVPIATAVTRHMSAYSVIVVGSFITAGSVFVLMFGASMTTVVMMTVILSLGECLWSPRLYEYTATIAPKGREGSYMGLSALPMFLAKMVAGPMSGFLLTRYCPKEGARDSATMWLIIGVVTLIGPILIVLLRKRIEGKSTVAMASKQALA